MGKADPIPLPTSPLKGEEKSDAASPFKGEEQKLPPLQAEGWGGDGSPTIPGLVYVSDRDPGIRRVKRGERFAYLGPDRRTLRDAAVLKRIASLAIPPAYVDVWICAHERGHLQATGHDARGRKQYRYHPDWRAARDGAKFARMIAFGEALPRLRRRLSRPP